MRKSVVNTFFMIGIINIDCFQTGCKSWRICYRLKVLIMPSRNRAGFNMSPEHPRACLIPWYVCRSPVIALMIVLQRFHRWCIGGLKASLGHRSPLLGPLWPHGPPDAENPLWRNHIPATLRSPRFHRLGYDDLHACSVSWYSIFWSTRSSLSAPVRLRHLGRFLIVTMNSIWRSLSAPALL